MKESGFTSVEVNFSEIQVSAIPYRLVRILKCIGVEISRRKYDFRNGIHFELCPKIMPKIYAK